VPRKFRYDTAAWAGLVAYIVAAEHWLHRSKQPLMSETYDRWLTTPLGRVCCWVVTLTTAGHLLNQIPGRWDPFHRLFWGKGQQ
jgi:hypothetical protein